MLSEKAKLAQIPIISAIKVTIWSMKPWVKPRKAPQARRMRMIMSIAFIVKVEKANIFYFLPQSIKLDG
jgi:hypothetical protein